jgi:ACS family tartrate transporter-like MFS transporter
MVLLSSLLYFLAMTSHYGYLFWAPTLVRDELHASSAVVGLITGGIACFAASVMLVVGASSDRTGERFFHAAACVAVAALGYVGAALLAHPVLRVVSLALVPAGVYGFLAPFWCLPSAILRGVAAAAGIAFVNSFGNLGGFVGPYALGVLKDATGSTTGALLGLATMAFAAAAMCLVLRRQAAFAFKGQASGVAVESAAVQSRAR